LAAGRFVPFVRPPPGWSGAPGWRPTPTTRQLSPRRRLSGSCPRPASGWLADQVWPGELQVFSGVSAAF